MRKQLNVRRQFILSCIEEVVIAGFLVAVLLAYRPLWVPIVLLGLAIFFAIKIVLFPWHQPVVGVESMLGAEAEVVEDLDPEGMVKFEGVLWIAVSHDGKISSGSPVRIMRVEGSRLLVVRA